MNDSENPLDRFLRAQGVLIVDGGLATALEARGFDLQDDLWSAGILMEAPDAIRQVHLDFLAAGADCITTSSYQASLPGFGKRGVGEAEAIKHLQRSVQLAVEARDTFWGEDRNRLHRLRPLVAASVGPYGAFLADGSEYTGLYDVEDDDLLAFHRRRWQVLAGTEAELLACETIPSHREARLLMTLLDETPGTWAWFSFSCRDGTCLCDGTPLVELARECDARARVAAVGVNCTSPRFIDSLIVEVRNGTAKPIIVYPNSGEHYDAEAKCWLPAGSIQDWGAAATEWVRLGAVGIGGCCRVGPSQVRAMRRALVPDPPASSM